MWILVVRQEVERLYPGGMTQLPDPLSRRDRQRQTREALIFAARGVFAEDGYHAASLERIARVAGFSKGAVYSNFDGKPDRKSTRLNSSHVAISYAVFCLKKK